MDNPPENRPGATRTARADGPADRGQLPGPPPPWLTPNRCGARRPRHRVRLSALLGFTSERRWLRHVNAYLAGMSRGGSASPGTTSGYGRRFACSCGWSGQPLPVLPGLGKAANCQVGVSVHLASEDASCAADWRLFCPESWDGAALTDPDDVRHTEKWRLALDMIDEMTGPCGWVVVEQAGAAAGARPAVTADAGYGDARPATPPRRPGRGRPAGAACPGPPANLRTLAIASADQVRLVTWRQGTRATASAGSWPNGPPGR